MTNLFWPTPAPDQLGPMIGPGDVRDAVKATILEWETWYLSVLSTRLTGKIGGRSQPANPLPNFGTWVNEPANRSWGTGQPAAFLVTVPATVGVPDRQGSGLVNATWRAQVEVQVFGTTWEETTDLVGWYQSVILWSLLQHSSLGGFAMATKWVGSQYRREVHTSTRTSGHCVLGFDVKVADVIDTNRGPSVVPSGAPGQDPTVLTTPFTLTRTPDTRPLPTPSTPSPDEPFTAAYGTDGYGTDAY